ncbi:hypothetical protein L218DRAFT_840765, partial [Marasmius fiardii PR-910]
TYFWSHDETGQVRLSIEEYNKFGLPTNLYIQVKEHPHFTLTTKTYKDINKWQHLRGFDPNTTDFARYLGYPAVQVVTQESSY